MRGNIYSRNIRRTIFGSLGRFIAILAIIALGVGFFAGVKNTKGSMMLTCDEYVSQYDMYDFRLISSYGFVQEDAKAIEDMDEVAAAEGSVTADFFSEDRSGNSIVLRAHTLMEKVNKVNLLEGRLPESDNECVADAHFFTADDIGGTVRVTSENDKDTQEAFEYSEYEIVGIVNSPYYMMKTERGATSLGDGKVDAYIYAPSGAFTSEYFTEIFVMAKEQGFVFRDEYDSNIDKVRDPITDKAEERAQLRYDDIVSEAQEEIDEARQELDDGRATLESERASAYSRLQSSKNTLDEKSSQIKSGKKELESQRASLNSQKQQVSDGIAQIEGQLALLDPQENAEMIQGLNMQLAELESSMSQIEGGLDKIDQEEANLKSAEAQIQSGYSRYYAGVEEAQSRFASAESELADGEDEIKDAEKELKKLEKPEIYVQDRSDNLGYTSFESNSDIVDSIAKIFPVFFFLIAALVCSTTMSRMIEEERTQIGALRALGYTSGKIMYKYMIYSGSAAIIGCVAGFFAGSKYFPYFIWIAYGMMYGFAPLEFYFNWQLALISLVVSFICSTGTTYFACRGQLKHMPAEILRPKAPKAGKRILLERAGFIWKRLKFLHKVSARNIFRYKKRMIMMMMGIGGCTALVLAGFGINDSIAGIADHQYSQIEKYHMTVVFSEEVDDDKLKSFEDEYRQELENTARLQQTSVNAKGKDVTKSCSLMVSDDDNIGKAVNFSENDRTLTYPEKGEALINNKLAEMLGVSDGDQLTLTYDDTKTVTLTVSGVYKNYVSNYIYINEETYEQDMDKEYEPNTLLVTFKDGSDIREMSELINDFDGVAGISANEDVKNRVDDMMVSLNYIIILVIGCAGALAFIVLFNLGNINITEREREIATIKVLGFFPRETGAYVFRENLILVMFGIVVGLPLGFVLHKFIMSRIVVDAVSFNEVVEPVSYLYTVAVVLCFAFIVDAILRSKLRKINMAEALKSIE